MNTIASEKEQKIKIEKVRRKEEEARAKFFAQKLGFPYINLLVVPIDIEAVGLVPEEAAKKAGLAVIQKQGKKIKIAAENPQNPQAQEIIVGLKEQSYEITIFIVSKSSLERAWNLYKEIPKPTEEITGKIKVSSQKLKQFQKEIKSIKELKEKINTVPTTEIMEIFLAGALITESSDIHIEPQQSNVKIRYRVDGVLQDMAFLPSKTHLKILSRIKLVSGLKINVRDIPQDGRFTIALEKTEIEVRVSVLPGAYGESVVMRLLNPKMIALELEELGMRKDLQEIAKEEIKRSTGMILITGPTGSGKTTTLYSFIRKINKPDIKIITIEDPIEYHIEGISQTQVEPEKGYNFSNGLRSIVRQDPDVVLVGEIRDAETANIAMHAALTGHLVFSTLHTNDAPGTIPRLINMEIAPYIIAPAINVAMAQRLVRLLCPKCKKRRKPTNQEMEKIKKALKGLPSHIAHPPIDENLAIYEPVGCSSCNEIGYKGRASIFEIFIIDDEMEKLILKIPSSAEVKEVAMKKGMVPMFVDGILKVLDGATTIEEVERVT